MLQTTNQIWKSGRLGDGTIIFMCLYSWSTPSDSSPKLYKVRPSEVDARFTRAVNVWVNGEGIPCGYDEQSET